MAGMESLFNNTSQGVKMAKERGNLDRLVTNTFTSRTDDDCLMDCYTAMDRGVEFWYNQQLQQQSLLSVEGRSFDETHDWNGRLWL